MASNANGAGKNNVISEFWITHESRKDNVISHGYSICSKCFPHTDFRFSLKTAIHTIAQSHHKELSLINKFLFIFMFRDDTRYELLQSLFNIKLQVLEKLCFPHFFVFFLFLQYHSPLGVYGPILNKIIFFVQKFRYNCETNLSIYISISRRGLCQQSDVNFEYMFVRRNPRQPVISNS